MLISNYTVLHILYFIFYKVKEIAIYQPQNENKIGRATHDYSWSVAKLFIYIFSLFTVIFEESLITPKFKRTEQLVQGHMAKMRLADPGFKARSVWCRPYEWMGGGGKNLKRSRNQSPPLGGAANRGEFWFPINVSLQSKGSSLFW